MPINKRIVENRKQENMLKAQYANAEVRYLGATTYDPKRRALEEIKRARVWEKDPLFFAKANFELAVLATENNELANSHLAESVEYAIKAERRAVLPSRRLDTVRFMSNLPLMTALHIEGSQPTILQLARSLGLHTTALRDCFFANLQTLNANRSTREESRNFMGSASESLALVALQQYALADLKSGDWTPVPSLLSQDHSVHRKNHNDGNWDISVFCGEEIEEGPPYLLQVKYRDQIPNRYADHITVVPVMDIPVAEGRKPRSLKSLVMSFSDVILNDNPSSTSTSMVRGYTENLLNVLG